MALYSSKNMAASLLIASFAIVSCPSATAITATASLGIAFLRLPPSNEINCSGTCFAIFQINLAINLLAFPLPLSISIPECPPSKPFIVISRMCDPLLTGISW